MAALFNQDVQVTNLELKDAKQKETSALHVLCLRSWPAVRTVSLDLAASDSSDDFSAAFHYNHAHFYVTVMTASEMHSNAFQFRAA